MSHGTDFFALVEEYRPLVKETDVLTVKYKLDNQESFTLIDVREEHEWNQGHIPNAMHMVRSTIERDIEKTIPDKDTCIVLYCGGGFRSVLSAYSMQNMGYTNVISMDGGIKDWLSNGYRLEI